MMSSMSSVAARARWALLVTSSLTLLAGCGGIRGRGETVDPDLQPMVATTPPPPPTFEPDEVIDAPDVAGVELVGRHGPRPRGPTQHVDLGEEPTSAGSVTAAPRRDPMPSFMTDIVLAPSGGD